MLSAADSIGISGYYVSKSSVAPSAEAFTPIEPPVTALTNLRETFTLSSSLGVKTLYAWFIDPAGNISSPAIANVNFSYGWVRIHGTEEMEESRGIAMDSSGNIYLVGSTMGDLGENNNLTIYNSAFVSKLNGAGNLGTVMKFRDGHEIMRFY